MARTGVPTDWLWLSVSGLITVIFDRFERRCLSVIWQFDEGGGHTPRVFSINGDYAPVVGDFDDDGCSDILWHDPADPDRVSPLWRCVGGDAFACDPPVEAPPDGFPIGSGLYG
ncbi:hypothetical protein [Enhygromyxa salina]|uniref:FG-GAP repeat protein n=1 Tax=Enhygromyxa salina TaxID=215803 RepID=A0A2S9XWQ3_9BACT|nr:hypothetical protein [Enhygromyxa salina]PRP97296.1 hypothetical protein ENSA7_66460 [Enhygromyxa salina]